jgi:hypothetical protein
MSHVSVHLLFEMNLAALCSVFSKLRSKRAEKRVRILHYCCQVKQNSNVWTKFSEIAEYKTSRKAVQRVWSC